MQLRVARHTNRLDELVLFYRDGLGLPEIGRFDDHEGYDGVFLAVPGSEEAVARMCERAGAEPVEPANPYWREHGVTPADPDGFRVVLVPAWWPAPAD